MDELCIFVLCGCIADVRAVMHAMSSWLRMGCWMCIRRLLCWLLHGEWYHPHVCISAFGGAHDGFVVMCDFACVVGEVHLASSIA
jgi:hypothetical protein